MKNEIKTTIKTVSFINAEVLYQDFLNLPDEEKIKFLNIIKENLNKLKYLEDLEFKNLLDELKNKTKPIVG